jgi:TolB-like protein
MKSRVKRGGSGQRAKRSSSGPTPALTEISKQEIPFGRPILIAVLPLRNLTNNPAKGTFADGLTDEVISELGQLSPECLRVIAYTSVAHYKQSAKSIEQIGQELGGDHVMEGGVRWYGRRLRMTARLIAVHDQAQVWADSFEIQLPALFALQQGLARELAVALSAKLRLPVTPRPRPGTTCIPAAHDAYHSGTQFFQRSEADVKKAIDLFSRAIEIDPNCAPAYAEISIAWHRLGFLYDYPPVATLWAMRELALKALALDPELCLGHAAMARWQLYGAWNWSEAEASSRRAVALNPSDGRGRIILATCHLVLHRPDEAVEEVREALRLDPLSPVIGTSLVLFGFLSRCYDMGIESCQKLLSHDASSPLVHAVLGAKGRLRARPHPLREGQSPLPGPDHLYSDALFSLCAGGSANFRGTPCARDGHHGKTTIRAIHLPGAGCGQPGKQRAHFGVAREGL